MALFFLEYDLRKKRDYEKIYKELEAFKAVRILESLWCFNRFNTNCSSLRDHFSKFIDPDDGLVISEVTDWATKNTTSTPKQLP